jgi:Putative Ig domain
MADPAASKQSQKGRLASLITWLKENLMVDPAGPMQVWKRVFLFFYLVIAGLVTIYFVYGLWAAEPQAAQWRPAAEPKYEDAEKPAAGTPKIKLIDPQTVTIGIGQASLRVFGYNFTKDSRVRFDDVDRLTQYVNEHQLVVPLSNSYFTTPGAIVITVANGERNANVVTSDAVTLVVEAAGSIRGEWRVLGCQIPIRQESRLILLVLFTGAFGACMSGLPSLADYLGDRKLVESWFTFYLIRPFVGGGIAFIFYLVIRGGFLAGTDVDTTAANPFGIAAIAALVGLFSSQALLKLREVSKTVFTAEDTRSDKLEVLAITTTPILPDAEVGIAYRHKLEASGGKPPYTWTAVTPLPAGLALNATGELTGTPTVATPTTRYTFQVTDSSGTSVTRELTLTVGPLTIPTGSPPDAPVGSPL